MHPFRRVQALSLAFKPFREADQLAHWRDGCVRDLVENAYGQVPYVRSLFRRVGLVPADIRSVSDLAALPLSSKRELQDAGLMQVVARNARIDRLLDRSTSGSTGERMLVKRTWFEERLLNAFRWRVLREYGLGPCERVAVALFHGAKDPRDSQALFRLAQRVGVRQMLILDVLGDPGVAQTAARYAPQALMGMTSAIAKLVEDVQTGGYSLQPRFVLTSGELLTDPLRQRIGTLGSRIVDVYGANECNFMAWQCPANAEGYHICDDAHIVEVLTADGRPAAVGEWGEVVVTNLISYAMPLIRYRIGDLAVRGPDWCACGSPFSTLLAVRGRTIDCFALPGGRVLHPWEILNVIRPYTGWVRQFQMVQTAPGEIVYRVLAARTPAESEIQAIEQAARQVLAGCASFRLNMVKTIESAPSGKSRPFIAYQQAVVTGL